jgi:hypothetical protein
MVAQHSENGLRKDISQQIIEKMVLGKNQGDAAPRVPHDGRVDRLVRLLRFCKCRVLYTYKEVFIYFVIYLFYIDGIMALTIIILTFLVFHPQSLLHHLLLDLRQNMLNPQILLH